MDLEGFRAYCAGKKGTYECFPFDKETLVMKVGSKMFALTNGNKEKLSISLKCEPLMAIDLRREYKAIQPGYHMNKQHWNTIELDGTIPEETIKLLIDLSYELVYKGLKKDEKRSIEDGKNIL